MRIEKIELSEVTIPLITPFKTALRTVDAVNDIIVRITADDGSVGFGEAPPTAVITGDTKGSIRCAIEDFIAPSILGMYIAELDAIEEKLRGCLVHNTSPKAAVDMALYDLWAKAQDKPLFRALGGSRRELETDVTVSLNPVDEMVADSLRGVADGFRILKIKVGREGLRDVERVEAIRRAVGPDIRLRVDANQGWTPDESVRIIRAMEDRALDIELVEQPVKAADITGLHRVTENVSTPILADESVFTPEDAWRIMAMHSADYVNIKLMKTGGIHEALHICRLAEQYGVQCMIGCMLESKVSVSAAAHLAAACEVITMADLDGPSLCREDPYPGGPVYDGPIIRMTDDPGIGIKAAPCFL